MRLSSRYLVPRHRRKMAFSRIHQRLAAKSKIFIRGRRRRTHPTSARKVGPFELQDRAGEHQECLWRTRSRYYRDRCHSRKRGACRGPRSNGRTNAANCEHSRCRRSATICPASFLRRLRRDADLRFHSIFCEIGLPTDDGPGAECLPGVESAVGRRRTARDAAIRPCWRGAPDASARRRPSSAE